MSKSIIKDVEPGWSGWPTTGVAMFHLVNIKRSDRAEPGGGVSLTVPGEGTNLRELLNRFVRTGQGVEGLTRVGSFPDEDPDLDDEDLEKFQGLDIAEKTELIEETRLRSEQAQRSMEERKKRKKEAEPVTRTDDADDVDPRQKSLFDDAQDEDDVYSSQRPRKGSGPGSAPGNQAKRKRSQSNED